MRISIITIGLNNREGYERTLASIAGQTYKNFELIVIDGGSTDGSVEVIRRYASHIAYWVSEPDGGIYNAMNKGIAAAGTATDSDYIIFMNSGDRFHAADVLERAAEQMAGGCDVYAGHQQMGEGGHIYHVPGQLRATYLLQRGLPHQSCFFRTALFEKIKYNDSHRIGADWELLCEGFCLGGWTYARLDFIVATFDLSGISYQKHNNALLEKERADVLARMFPPFLREALVGRNKMERRMLYALTKENLWKRDTKILRNVLKRMPGDFFRTYLWPKRKNG